MNPETQTGEHVGVEIRAGRPWFAVCCASCLLILIFVGGVIGYVVTRGNGSVGYRPAFIQRLLNN